MNKLYLSGLRALIVCFLFWFALLISPTNTFDTQHIHLIALTLLLLVGFTMNASFFRLNTFSFCRYKLTGIIATTIFIFLLVNLLFAVADFGFYFLESSFIYLPLFIVTCSLLEFCSKETYLQTLGKSIAQRRYKEVNWKYYVVTSFIKVFFGTFLFDALVTIIEYPLNHSLSDERLLFVPSLLNFGIFVDVSIGLTGYVFAAKYFKNTIKSFNPYALAFIVCFICYPPLNSFVSSIITAPDTFNWEAWLTPGTFAYWLWATLISITWGVYWWATVAFGNTFSNLTYRRLIYWGPYKFCAHPAYLAKNVYWWLFSVPFVYITSWADTLMAIAVLLFWNSVYYLRAKTEEMHLKHYPAYRNYLKKVPLKCL